MSERDMENDDKGAEKQRPSHRVSFARINGQDRQGRDILGPAREIGSIWDRKGKEGEAILRFDHIPEEMRGRDGGVLFVSKVQEREPERPPGKSKDSGHER